MKTSEKKIDEENVEDSSNKTVDPFAVDFFGGQNSQDTGDHTTAEANIKKQRNQLKQRKKQKGLDWFRSLPKVSVSEAEFSNQILELPNEFSRIAIDSFKKIFSKFTQLDESSINCTVFSIKEVSLFDSMVELSKTPKVYLSIKSKANLESANLALSADFASSLIDLVLGGKGEKPTVLRNLSPIEKTIVEFLSINILTELNENLDDTDFVLQSVENEIPPSTDIKKRGAEIVVSLSFGKLDGIAIFLMPFEFLYLFRNSQKSLFLNDSPKEKLEKYRKISNDLPLNIDFGNTQVNANDILFLEKDDVVLIEDPKVDLQEKITVYVGDSTNYYLRGSFYYKETEAETDILTDKLLLEVEEIFSEKDSEKLPKRKKMDNQEEVKESNKSIDETTEQETELENNDAETQENLEAIQAEVVEEEQEEEIDEEALASLENVMVNLRVSLGGRRLSLSELQKIRVGQIIDLGCRPNDPVEVLTDSDNRPIASGELVEIEGQIGVRLTKVFV